MAYFQEISSMLTLFLKSISYILPKADVCGKPGSQVARKQKQSGPTGKVAYLVKNSNIKDTKLDD